VREDVRKIIERFGLVPHPEGGHFREVFRSKLAVQPVGGGRAPGLRRSGGTLIYFLLAGKEFSAFHRVRGADEIWHLYAGGPLELHTINMAAHHELHLLTHDVEHGSPVAVVPADCLQAARLAHGVPWALCGCTVAPGFEFTDFEMPPAAELLATFPAHEQIVRELTRS
jgi:predicted cupin superfamily sugar epimerase